MKDFKEQLYKIKPWLILTTYIFILFMIILNLDSIIILISNILGLLKPFFYAIGIAYVLNIPMTAIENAIHNKLSPNNIIYKKARTIAIILSLLLAIGIIVFLVLYITPQLIYSLSTLFNNIGIFLSGLTNNINEILRFLNIDVQLEGLNVDNFNIFISNMGINWDNLINTLTEVLRNASFNIVNYTVSFVSLLITWVVGTLLSIYLMSSKETMLAQCKKVMYYVFDYDISKKIFGYLTQTNKIFKSFVGGQLVEAIIIGILIYIMMLITNMPYSLLIATIVAVMALIPVFGAMFAMVIGFILILSVDIWQAMLFIVLFQFIQILENNLIYPKIVGSSVGLPAIWTLLSIIVFGGLYGVLGMLFAVPLTASVYVLASEVINKKVSGKDIL